MLRASLLIFAWALAVFIPDSGLAKSAFGSRHTGLEPPGSPKRLENMPGNALSRTPEGGMGYVDAYGNSMLGREPQEKARRHRPGPGAYGGYGQKAQSRPLPDPDKKADAPMWNYRK